MKPLIETYTGRLVSFTRPRPEQIEFRDIAWALSRLARFNGHTQGEYPYTVAQHSVWVAYVAQHHMAADKETIMQALFHDAHEAYMGDITTPLKSMTALKNQIEKIATRLQAVIHEALLIPTPDKFRTSLIEEADRYALAVEARHLITSTGKDWPGAKDVPDELYELFWTPLPAQKAFTLFWLARDYIASDTSLEQLWRCI